MKNSIYLGLGSNKGNKVEYLRSAVKHLNADENINVIAASSLYESEPYGLKDQDTFYNAAIEIRTGYNLHQLLDKIKKIEKEIGRINGVKWGPREIDIDLLFYGDMIHSDERLTIPHKEVLLRDFVIIPLKEIAPDFFHPVEKIKLKNIDTSKIEKLIFKVHKSNLLEIDNSDQTKDGAKV